MKLRQELQDRREHVTVEMIALAAKRDELLHEHNVLFMQRDDLERAIAALTPATTDEGWLLEPGPADLFEAEKAEAREQLEREDDASEFAEPMPEAEFVVLDEQICEPVEESPALNADMVDVRELTADELTLAADVDPTDGYAPVTNPEADELAKANDYYNPDAVAERNKFSPWGIFGHKRETGEVS